MTNSKEELIQKIESAREVLNKSLDEKKQYDEVTRTVFCWIH